MDEMKKYECPDCGAVKEVEVSAEAPTCEDCEVTMQPVVADVEDIGVGDEWEDEEEDELE